MAAAKALNRIDAIADGGKALGRVDDAADVGKVGKSGGKNFDEARREAFENAGMTDPKDVKFTKQDPERQCQYFCVNDILINF